MDRTADFSRALFAAFCIDCGVVADERNPFNPFPDGIPPELGPDRYARFAACISLFKKSEVEESDTAEEETLEKFQIANRVCENVNLVEDFDLSNDCPAVGYSISAARELLYQWFTNVDDDITMSSIEVAARFGPGASVGLHGRPSSLYFKVGDAPMTASSPFIRSWYEQSVSFIPLCEAAEMARKAKHGDIQLESCGSLSFVPKSYAAKRIVVTEPSLNTYFQLGLGREMERLLQKNTGISFDSQPGLNAELARIGSMSGAYATMDLTQCSDFISLALAKFMFPSCLFKWMKILRTGSVRLKKERHGEKIVELHMMSTMGNGFTFPMQTVLLSALVLGVYNTLGISSGVKARSWGVFGDDIVVRTEAFSLLSKVLARLQLRVNASKSYCTGPFRESCGHDYYQGRNVRGVYLKRYSTDQDLFSCFNRIAIWGAREDLEMKNSLSLILACIRGTTPIVPPDASIDSGIILPNPPTSPQGDGTWVYYSFEPNRNSFSFDPWELFSIGQTPTSKAKSRRFKRWLSDLKRYCDGSINEPALLKVLLAGGLRRNRVVMRKRDSTYKLMEKLTPRWGYSPVDSVPIIGSLCFERWDRNVRLALDFLVDLTS